MRGLEAVLPPIDILSKSEPKIHMK